MVTYLNFIADTPPSYTNGLSLHDALPISGDREQGGVLVVDRRRDRERAGHGRDLRRPDAARDHDDLGPYRSGVWVPQVAAIDRKSTRLNSSHVENSYAVLCLKKNWTYGHISQLHC